MSYPSTSFEITEEDVRKQLELLGFTNVSETVLKAYVRKLRIHAKTVSLRETSNPTNTNDTLPSQNSHNPTITQSNRTPSVESSEDELDKLVCPTIAQTEEKDMVSEEIDPTLSMAHSVSNAKLTNFDTTDTANTADVSETLRFDKLNIVHTVQTPQTAEKAVHTPTQAQTAQTAHTTHKTIMHDNSGQIESEMQDIVKQNQLLQEELQKRNHRDTYGINNTVFLNNEMTNIQKNSDINSGLNEFKLIGHSANHSSSAKSLSNDEITTDTKDIINKYASNTDKNTQNTQNTAIMFDSSKNSIFAMNANNSASSTAPEASSMIQNDEMKTNETDMNEITQMTDIRDGNELALALYTSNNNEDLNSFESDHSECSQCDDYCDVCSNTVDCDEIDCACHCDDDENIQNIENIANIANIANIEDIGTVDGTDCGYDTENIEKYEQYQGLPLSSKRKNFKNTKYNQIEYHYNYYSHSKTHSNSRSNSNSMVNSRASSVRRLHSHHHSALTYGSGSSSQAGQRRKRKNKSQRKGYKSSDPVALYQKFNNAWKRDSFLKRTTLY